ncbi:P-loop ATPase, Sll1717 family [Aestuariivirga sp. YIM B02566]|uniref:Uncharacterized protein n=1 Tax=Taklimakanibacter albus TaxID=2800327 RepID=A0ACC5QYZ7_9HYPH|nr:hypothetical protein [Aestuariivirga sp. YIM B02566]MBK1865615.1 hypothetical protein [Aestuariivirga sp. YIM B02566]
MVRALKVFVSYSRHGDEAKKVRALVDWLTNVSGSKINFIVDSELRSDDDVFKFERSISSYSAVLVLGTREYKRKVLSGNFGVTRELQAIVARRSESGLRVLTAIMEATHSEVFPDVLAGPIAKDFVGLGYDRNTGLIPDHMRTMFHGAASTLVEDLLEPTVQPLDDELTEDEIRRKLFFEQKHEQTVLPPEIFNKIFVKTLAYTAAVETGAYLFIGRKGSGKSFLTDFFTRNSTSSSDIQVGIHLRDYDLSNIFALKASVPLGPNFEEHFSQADLLEGAWSLAIVSASVLSFYVRAINGEIQYENHRLANVGEFAAKSECIVSSDAVGHLSVDYCRLLDWCISKTYHVVNAGIANLSSKSDYDAAIVSIPRLYKPSSLVRALLGGPAMSEIVEAFNRTKPKFVLTLDGFDSKFDRFRAKTQSSVFLIEKKEARNRFEIDWIAGLIESVVAFESAVSGGISFMKGKLRFLITLPKDRFAEFRGYDRDAYRFRTKHEEIRWGADELMILIRKRLEVYFGRQARTKSASKVRVPVYQVFSEAFSWIAEAPSSISFNFHGSNVEIDTFSYLLRHSFWRPRDLIHHIAKLLLRANLAYRTGRPITGEKLRDIVRESSKVIIEDEFLKEFSTIFPEIRKAVHGFRKAQIELSYTSVHSILADQEYRMSSGDFLRDTDSKIAFLFEIGFLGCVLPDKLAKHFKAPCREIFSFSDRFDVLNQIERADWHEFKWIVHPIFSEYLQLDTSGPGFLLNYDIHRILDDE